MAASLPVGATSPSDCLKDFLTRINAHDPIAVGRIFTRDAQLVEVHGTRFKGREKLHEGITWAMSEGPLSGDVRVSVESIEEQPVTDDVVIVHALLSRTGGPAPAGRMEATAVAKRGGEAGEGRWALVAFANVPIVEEGGPKGKGAPKP